MGDRVAVMRRGELQQVAPPQELYDRPVNLFVGGFIGSPAMNLLTARLEREGGWRAVLGDGVALALDDEMVAARPGIAGYAGREVVLGIRPEDLEDAALAGGAPEDRRLRGELRLRESLGSEVMAHVAVAARAAETGVERELGEHAGLNAIGGDGSGTAVLVGRLSPRTQAREGEQLELAVDTRALHVFDPQTGLGIYDANAGGTGT